MKLGFCLYKYFPYGGLQRDFLAIAKACNERGHEIYVYTFSWQGDIPDFCKITFSPKFFVLSNHKRYQKFSTWFAEKIKQDNLDGVIGFNKMPNLDVYYAADPCFLEKALTTKKTWYRHTQRFKHFSTYEAAVFDASQKTEILMISDVQKPFFIKHYQTQDDRLHFLPPGISPDRKAPENKSTIRQQFRQTLHIKPGDFLVLLIGSGFKTKGVDRALYAIASLPEDIRKKTHLRIIGQDNPKYFQRLAKKLTIDAHVQFMNGRDDIPNFLFSADLLLHPAYAENAGMVIVEAIVAGLPVLVTDVCGYAHFVNDTNAGVVLSSPYQQSELNDLLLNMLISNQKNSWSENGIAFGKDNNLYGMPKRAAEIIDQILKKQLK